VIVHWNLPGEIASAGDVFGTIDGVGNLTEHYATSQLPMSTPRTAMSAEADDDFVGRDSVVLAQLIANSAYVPVGRPGP
jgi:hypothetical protein